MSPRRNWDSPTPSLASECAPPPGTKGGWHIRLPKGVGPGPTLAWPGWKRPDIPVEVDTDRLETSCTDAGVLKKLSLAGLAKLSRLS